MIAVYWQLSLLALSLGLDNLSVAVGIGVQGVSGRRAFAIAALFALFQTALPAAGIWLGSAIGPRLGDYAGYVGFSALFVLGVLTTIFALRPGKSGFQLSSGTGLILAAGGVSLDSLAVGFSLALVGFPPLITVIALGLSAWIMTWAGLLFGRQIGARMEEWAEAAAGAVLAVTGLVLFLHKLLG
ncbi:MAG: manganese efflux pump [Thermaerobacter sp.]|nr:manganese efflux pump [Thermaerobacter sp.]